MPVYPSHEGVPGVSGSWVVPLVSGSADQDSDAVTSSAFTILVSVVYREPPGCAPHFAAHPPFPAGREQGKVKCHYGITGLGR